MACQERSVITIPINTPVSFGALPPFVLVGTDVYADFVSRSIGHQHISNTTMIMTMDLPVNWKGARALSILEGRGQVNASPPLWQGRTDETHPPALMVRHKDALIATNKRYRDSRSM